ncbi:MAG: hypothetical protein COB05_05340 [Marinobacter sp.]|nr:MAG: hypothetical protein COB05_05340 [Marinobacter sp.]
MIDIDETALETVKTIGAIDPDKLPGGRVQAVALAQILVRDAISLHVDLSQARIPWISVKDRLPEIRTVTRKTPNGILVRFDNGKIRHSNDVTELLVNNMRNGPRQPTKYEAPAPARITHWLDLDAAESGPGGRNA